MVIFVVLVMCIWVGGHLLKVPRQVRLLMVTVLYFGALSVVVFVPETASLRQIVGGSIRGWLFLAGLVLAFAGYRRVLGHLKKRAAPDVAKTPLYHPQELERYARHIVLREIGGPGQKRLKQARVLVVGAGGLGAPVLQYLAAAGVGTIGVIDDDTVENSNLQRQVIHKETAIGQAKVASARAEMLAQNPHIEVKTYHRRLTDDIADDLFANYDLVLDGTDNFETRYLVNRTCVAKKKPLIAAALSQWEGQISIYDPASGAPCYACVFPRSPAAGLAPSCAEAGVLGPLPGVVGAMMAVEAIKEITGAGQSMRGRLMIYDSLYGENRIIAIGSRRDCDICGARERFDIETKAKSR